MNEAEWLAKEQELRALAFKELVLIAESPTSAGYITLDHIIEKILRLDIKIYNVLGDCP